MKQKLVILFILALALAITGCGKKDAAESEPASEPDLITEGSAAEENTAPPASSDAEDAEAFQLFGLILDDDGSDRARMTMYGFLHTAENLSCAAKIYRAAPGAETEAALDQAVSDGVNALLFFDPTGSSASAIKRAADNGMHVVVSYYPCDSEGVSANIVADTGEYYDELARGLAERMTERSLRSGRILIYGRDTTEAYDAFSASVSANYPQFRVESFTRAAADEEQAIAELAQYLLYNRDIKGMYVADSDLASIAIKARSQAQKIFKEQGAPSPTVAPSATLAPGETPVPTPNPGLLTQITITVFCNGLSNDNYDLFNDNDIYALCIEPYYEAAAEATMALDKLLDGETVQSVSKVNRPIVYNETADKYKAIFDQMNLLFEVD